MGEFTQIDRSFLQHCLFIPSPYSGLCGASFVDIWPSLLRPRLAPLSNILVAAYNSELWGKNKPNLNADEDVEEGELLCYTLLL